MPNSCRLVCGDPCAVRAKSGIYNMNHTRKQQYTNVHSRCIFVLCMLLLSLERSQANRFAWSTRPRLTAVQSPLSGSHSSRRKGGGKADTVSRDPQTVDREKQQTEDDTLVTHADARFSNEEERRRLFAVQLPFSLKQKPPRKTPIDAELEYIDALTLPCSSVVKTSAKNTPLAGGAVTQQHRPLAFWETMICGAISRSVAQTLMHPANTMKTILQQSTTETMVDLLRPTSWRRLSCGAGANFLLSVPSGAVNFAVLEAVRRQLATLVERQWGSNNKNQHPAVGPSLDFVSSVISTITCSVIATPQMMIVDNIMAGNYPNLVQAIRGIAASSAANGGNPVSGFYRGLTAGLVGKIPSYALTWTFFQQIKTTQKKWTGRPATDIENSIMGCIASATTVSIMIPMDTIKTRLVTQMANSPNAYKGIIDCAVRVAREEGMGAFYKGLPPRLVSVVPMIGIQFGVYEFMRRNLMDRKLSEATQKLLEEKEETYGREGIFEEAFMEVAASADDPCPAPHFLDRVKQKARKKNKRRQVTNRQRSSK